MKNRLAAAAIFVVFALASSTFGQALADRVPDDAVIYFGWSGADSPGPAYANSHLKAILDNSKIRELFTQFAPQVVEKIIQKEPDSEKPLHAFLALWTPMWKYPSAFFFAGLDTSNPQQPIPRLGLICKAGAEAANVKKQVDELLAEAGEAPVPIETFESDGLVGIVVGYPEAMKALAGGAGGGGPGALKNSAGFTSALKQVQSESMFFAYIDVEKIVGIVEQIVQAENDEQAKVMVPKVIDALGIRGLKHIVHSAGFDGQDWMGMTFVDAPAPRTGLLELLDGKPISPDLLKAVPADATFVATGRFDAARLINQIKLIAGNIDPQGPALIDKGLGAAQLALAKNLVTDVLEPLGSDWAVYCSPTVAGNGILGLAVVNKLDDPAKAQASLPTAWINLSNWVAVAMSKAEAEVEVRGRYTKVGDLTIYYLGVPVAAPSWGIKDGYLYAGLFPNSVAGAVNSTARSGGKSITENERFIALQKRLGVKDACSFSFFDLQSTAASGSTYQMLMLVGRYAGFGDLFGVPAPEPLLPPLHIVQQHLGPAGSATWIDDAGVHTKSIATFPGAKLFSEPGMLSGVGAGGSALMASILLPSLNRARETANRVKSASNLRQIGMGMLLYANEHQGQYPPDFATILKTQDVTGEVFISPRTRSSFPHGWGGMTADQRAEWINANADYVYLGEGKSNDAGAEVILAYENPEKGLSDGINILYGDGHVEFQMMEDAMQEIARQRK